MRDVPGTGKSGRVLKEDIYTFLEQQKAPLPVTSQPAPEIQLEDKRKEVQGFTKTMVKTMTASNQIPHLGFSDEVRMDELVRLREQLKEPMSERGIRFTYMPLLIKVRIWIPTYC